MSDPQTPKLDRMQIPEPCPMAQALERGEAADRRYCELCEENVVNLSALNRAAAEQELTRAQEAGKRLCVRVVRDIETGQVLTKDDLPILTERLAQHRPPKIAAALALALLQWSCGGGTTTTEPENAEDNTVAATTVGELVGGERALTEEELQTLMELGGYICD